jgi:tetratricopeptide (TPR) repeat protein
MKPLQQKLASAINLRESEKYEEARELLLELHAESPDDPEVSYGSLLPCAWIHDLLGREREAIPFYEKAIQSGLSGDDLKSTLLGMGSTYRCIGEYQKSIDTFQQARTLFPHAHEFNVFLAMTYYNIGEHSKAMELLLDSLVNTSKDEGILRYQRAIRFYSDKLDQIW